MRRRKRRGHDHGEQAPVGHHSRERDHLARPEGAIAAFNELAEMAEDPKVKPGSKKWIQKRAEASREMTLAQQALGLNAVKAI